MEREHKKKNIKKNKIIIILIKNNKINENGRIYMDGFH